jgi:hypothetical protein
MEKETLHALGDPGAEIGHFRDSNKKEREIMGREGDTSRFLSFIRMVSPNG